MATIEDRRTFVQYELGNRADLSQAGVDGAPSRIDNWIWQSYLNLGMSYGFDESETTIQGQWQNGMNVISYPDDARAIKALTFYRQSGTVVRVNWKDIAYIRRYSIQQPGSSNMLPSVGPPSVVADYANDIYVRPLCDQSIYNYYLDYWQKPQQALGGTDGDNSIQDTELQVPEDWLEVIDMGAMMRGHISLGEKEKAGAIQQNLFGFTIPTTGKFVPGLIATMWTRRQAQAPFMDYGIQPRQAKRSYGSTAG